MTEEVTGLDLVEIALRIAGGGPLGIDEPPVSTGTAVQVRVNTETVGADRTVVPQAGTLTRFGPPTGRNVRVDTHGHDGYVISPRYDSLLAKVIATGPDLATAARRAGRALGELVVEAWQPTPACCARCWTGRSWAPWTPGSSTPISRHAR